MKDHGMKELWIEKNWNEGTWQRRNKEMKLEWNESRQRERSV